jgi:hypothetical protein
MMRRALPWMWLLVAPACGSSCEDDGPPDEGAVCVGTPSCDLGAPPEVAEIGTRDHGFTPWQDGDVMELVFGSQGGVMILPSFCMPAPAAGGDQACVGLTLTNDLDGADGGPSEGEGEGPFNRRFQFSRDGERLCGGPLYDMLGYSRSDFGDTARVSVDLCGAGVHAAGEVTVAF